MGGEAEAHDREEIRMILSSSREQGVLEHRSWALLERIFEFDQRLAREIMTPKHEVVCLDADAPLEKNLSTIKQFKHVRYPVYRDHPDNIVAVLHIQSFLQEYTGEGSTDLQSALHEPLVVPETVSAHDLRQKFQAEETEMAIVVDEYGSFLGIVTMEDLVEEIFGEFTDELDDELDPMHKYEELDRWEINANVLAEKVFATLNITPEDHWDDMGIDTIGGYVMAVLGRKPREGDKIEIDGYRFQVKDTSGFGIARLLVDKIAEGKEEGVKGRSEKEGHKEEVSDSIAE